MLAIFSIAPHSGEEHLSPYVAQMIQKIEASGLEHQLTAMGTLVEGEPQAIFDLIRDCHMLIRGQTKRVSTKIWIDDQVGKAGRMKDKVKTVEEKLEK